MLKSSMFYPIVVWFIFRSLLTPASGLVEHPPVSPVDSWLPQSQEAGEEQGREVARFMWGFFWGGRGGFKKKSDFISRKILIWMAKIKRTDNTKC